MLSGREQELAGRLREAASQVIGRDDDDSSLMRVMRVMMIIRVMWVMMVMR